MSGLLRARARGVGRFAAEVALREPVSSALVAAGAVALTIFLARFVERPAGASTVMVATLLLVMLAHGARRDARFLLLSGHAPRRAFALEYALLSLPVAALLLTSALPALAPAMLLAAPLVAMLPPAWLAEAAKRRASGNARVRLAPIRDFEWLSGSRRALPAVLLCYLLALLLSAVPMLLVSSLTLVTWIACGNYGDAEGRPMLLAFGVRPAAFLRVKVGRALVQWVLWAAPVGALLLMRHPALWPVLAVALLANASVLSGTVLSKYTAYREGRTGGAAAALAPALLTLSLLMPPVTIFVLIRLWRTASHNLRPYLGTLG
jgi:hypothetical protein